MNYLGSAYERLRVAAGSIATTVSLTSCAFRNVIRFRYGTGSGLSVFNDRADRYAYIHHRARHLCLPSMDTINGADLNEIADMCA